MSRRRRPRSLADLEAQAVRRRRAVQVIFYVLGGAAFILFVINAATLGSGGEEASLAQRWWSLIPALLFLALATIVAARSLWLSGREVRVRRWLAATRPLHSPLLEARAAESRLLAALADLPGGRADHEAVLARARVR